MAYIAPAIRLTGDLVTAAIWNADIVANEIAINAGAIALASQAIGDLVIATSTTQLGRVADVATGQVLVSGGVATAPAYSASPSITALTYTTSLKSTTALATPAALTATQATAFAHSGSGAAIMGFGTTNDVSLMNRAGTVVLGIGPNTTAVNMVGTLSVAGLATLSSGADFTATASGSHKFGSASFGDGQVSILGNGSGSNVLAIKAGSTQKLILFEDTGGNVIGSFSSAGLLAVSGSGTSTFTGGVNSSHGVEVTNTTNGTNSRAALTLTNGSSNGYLWQSSTSNTESGGAFANSLIVLGEAAGGLQLRASNASGAIRFYSGGSTERMIIDSAGQVGLGGSSSTNVQFIIRARSGFSGLQAFMNSSAGEVAVRGDASVNSSSAYPAYFINSGAGNGQYLNNTGSWIAISDRRQKRLIREVSIDLDAMRRLVPSTYVWNNDETDTLRYGFIAQEVQAEWPTLVTVSPDGYLGVEYTGLIAPLVLGWQQHDTIIQQLAARIAALETKDH